MEKIKIGGYYKHYKGCIYRVLSIIKDGDTGDDIAICEFIKDENIQYLYKGMVKNLEELLAIENPNMNDIYSLEDLGPSYVYTGTNSWDILQFCSPEQICFNTATFFHMIEIEKTMVPKFIEIPDMF